MALIIVDAMMPCKVGNWHCRALASVKPNQRHAKHVTPKLDGVSLQNAKSRDVRASKSSRLHPQENTTTFIRLWQETSLNNCWGFRMSGRRYLIGADRRKWPWRSRKSGLLVSGYPTLGYLNIMIQPACYLAFLQKANLTCSCLMISTFWSPYLSTYTYTHMCIYIYNI